MELRHLRYFLTLAEELHFGKAAKKLSIAQPPLSRQIKNLEEELNVELFNRTKRSVQLTGYGKYLKDEAVKLFQHVELIKNHIRLLDEGHVGQIKIGYVGSAMHSVLPEVLTEVQRKLPEIHTSMIELMNLDQIVALETGSLDIGFIRTPITIDGLYIQPIFSETLSVILPLSHPLAGAEEVRLAHLAKEPFIGFCRECAPGLFDCIIGLCNRDGFSPCVVHESSQINSVVRLVESGLGYSIVPTSVKKAYNVRVRFYELDGYPERAELALTYHPDHQTPTSKRVIEIVQALKFDSV
jgi:DNA-binding transcriptional LysR family regulator